MGTQVAAGSRWDSFRSAVHYSSHQSASVDYLLPGVRVSTTYYILQVDSEVLIKLIVQWGTASQCISLALINSHYYNSTYGTYVLVVVDYCCCISSTCRSLVSSSTIRAAVCMICIWRETYFLMLSVHRFWRSLLVRVYLCLLARQYYCQVRCTRIRTAALLSRCHRLG